MEKKVANIVFYKFDGEYKNMKQAVIFYDDGTVKNVSEEEGQDVASHLLRENNVKTLEEVANKKYVFGMTGEQLERNFQKFVVNKDLEKEKSTPNKKEKVSEKNKKAVKQTKKKRRFRFRKPKHLIRKSLVAVATIIGLKYLPIGIIKPAIFVGAIYMGYKVSKKIYNSVKESRLSSKEKEKSQSTTSEDDGKDLKNDNKKTKSEEKSENNTKQVENTKEESADNRKEEEEKKPGFFEQIIDKKKEKMIKRVNKLRAIKDALVIFFGGSADKYEEKLQARHEARLAEAKAKAETEAAEQEESALDELINSTDEVQKENSENKEEAKEESPVEEQTSKEVDPKMEAKKQAIDEYVENMAKESTTAQSQNVKEQKVMSK